MSYGPRDDADSGLTNAGYACIAGGLIVLATMLLPWVTWYGSVSGWMLVLVAALWPVVVAISGLAALIVGVIQARGGGRDLWLVAGLAGGAGLVALVLFASGDQWGNFSILSGARESMSLGLGIWLAGVGSIVTLVGAWMAYVASQVPAGTAGRPSWYETTRSTPQLMSQRLVANNPSSGAAAVPTSLMGSPSSGRSDARIAPIELHFADDTPEGLVRQVADADRTRVERRGVKVKEAVWFLTTPPSISCALGDPTVTYRPKWPGRPTVVWSPVADATASGSGPSVIQPESSTPDGGTPLVGPAVSPALAADASPASPTPAAVALAPDDRPRRKCPDCAELVFVEAKICRYCRRDLSTS